MNASVIGASSAPNPDQDRVHIRTEPDDLSGSAAVVELVVRRDHEPPLHRYRNHDLVLCVIAGELTFAVNGHPVPAAPGAVVRVPRGTECGYAIASDTAHLLVIVAPAGPETYLAGLYHPGPAPCASVEDMVTAAAHFGIDITGPRPTTQDMHR